MVMKVLPRATKRSWIANFLADQAGSIAPLVAVAVIPLVIAAGSAADIGRAMDVRSQLQDISDSAALAGLAQATTGAEVSTATSFVNAAVSKLPGTPTVAAVYTYNSTAGTLQVSLSTKIATTFGAMVIPSIPAASTSTAAGTFAVNVVFTLSNFNSSAYDLDQVYYYPIPSGMTGATLYQWVPTLSKAQLVLSNASGFSNVSKTVQVPRGDAVGFALANKTGGVVGYGSNCYGQAQGQQVIYYSHREDGSGSYWDYGAPAFKACTSSPNSSSASITYNGNTLLTPCNSADSNNVTSAGFAAYSSGNSWLDYLLGKSSVNASSTCSSSVTYSAGNYVYYTDVNSSWKAYDSLYGTAYSRNPLRFSTTNTDCTQGDVGYQWDDNGGGGDDNDYNDADFTVNCTTLGLDKSTIRLIS
ncbi:MAG: TadE/TadG family type IV pilus assembly protein [Caulobacteraceae bacterium]